MSSETDFLKLSCCLSYLHTWPLRNLYHQYGFSCHSWTDFSSIQTRTSWHFSTEVFKVSVLNQGGLESFKVVLSLYFPLPMNSMITAFFHSHLLSRLQQRSHYGSCWIDWI